MNTHRTSATSCPACEAQLDGHTNVDGDGAPRARDFTVCFYCGAALRFAADLSLRELTGADRLELGPARLAILERLRVQIRSRGGDRV